VIRTRFLAVAAALVCAAALPVAGGAATGSHRKVKAPPDAKYTGTTEQHRRITLQISGKSIQILSFKFNCSGVRGTTSLDDIPLKKGKKGYKFSITAYALVEYSDDQKAENAPVTISGLFGRRAKTVKGRLRVKTTRCGDTPRVKWSAHL
jgi:hypothetical protein